MSSASGTHFRGPLLPSYNIIAGQRIAYEVASVPDAADFEGSIIFVSNGNAGAPSLAVSDGTSWLRIALGAAISATL